jgi:hypothetical protein
VPAKTSSGLSFQRYNPFTPEMLRIIFLALIRCVRSRRELVLENLALRQQLAVLAARQRPKLRYCIAVHV